MRRCALLAVAAVLAGCGGATSTADGAVALRKVGDFSSPVYVTSPPRDKSLLFVVEQGGRIRVVRDGKVLAAPFLDIHTLVSAGGERGLLSMAFAPDYATSGLFYVDYTDTQGTIRVVEYHRASAVTANPASARLVFSQPHPVPNHNGGQLQFGPDKLLYIGVGDGGGEGDEHGAHGNGQSLATVFGKILRIDPRPSGGKPYGVPASNPFVHRAGARPEIYAYGLRNPWRFSFDSATGNIVIGDVGQDKWEEVDYERSARGDNFGWRVYEGDSRYHPEERAPGAKFPVITESHSAGNCAIIGGYVIHDPSLAAWRGRYVLGDECRGVIQTARLRLGHKVKPVDSSLKVSGLSSFGVDGAGHIYAVSLSGPVYRLVTR